MVRRRGGNAVAVIGLCAALSLGGATDGVALAQGGAALLAKPLDEMARPNPLQGLPQGAQNMAQNFANGGAPQGAAPAPADATPPAEVPFFTVKYIPAYFVTVLAAGLGLFTVCKFSGRRRDV
jgi:hypothetical protein